MIMRFAVALVVAVVTLAPAAAFAQPAAPSPAIDWRMSLPGALDSVLPLREQARVFNEILGWRLDNVLPAIMRREGVDMWIVMCFEYDEDPIYMTLVPKPAMSARRLSILIFHDRKDGFQKLTANWHGSGSAGAMYTNIFTDRSKGANHQLTVVADYIRQHDPRKIAINYAPHDDYHDDFSHGNGLSAFHKEKLERALDRKYVERFVPGERICMGWYETRSPRELSLYRQFGAMTHQLIAEFFSNGVIVPDVTTSDDVEWWIRQRIDSLGLETWFHPSIDIQRSPKDQARYGKDDRVIRRGDMLHSDVGIRYLGLCTDMQHNAYVLRQGETEPPAGLKALLAKGNRLQEIHFAEMREGRTGNDILRAIVARGKAEGLRPTVYTHPIGPVRPRLWNDDRDAREAGVRAGQRRAAAPQRHGLLDRVLGGRGHPGVGGRRRHDGPRRRRDLQRRRRAVDRRVPDDVVCDPVGCAGGKVER